MEGFFDDLRTPVVSSAGSEGVSTTDTSRNQIFAWKKPMSIPSGRDEWPYAQIVANLKVSIIEQRGVGGGKIITRYAASGTFSNGTQDDKTLKACTWKIRFLDAAETVIDTFDFPVSHSFCSYPELPFTIPPTPSAFNFFDVIKFATAQGHKPAGYQGGC